MTMNVPFPVAPPGPAPQSKLEKLVRDYVSRARAGDQNAQGMLQTIGRQSRDSNAPMRLKVTARLVEQALRGDFGNVGNFGADAPDLRPVGDGRIFTNARAPKALPVVCLQVSKFKNAEKALVSLFLIGPRLKPSLMQTYARAVASMPTAGACRAMLERAQALQLVRDGLRPLGSLSPALAWEVGE